jgi:hypothetical protein
MTKVTLHYDLHRPLTEEDLARIPGLYSVYGFVRVAVAPSREKIDVDYDASRLTKGDLEATLARHGVPIRVAAKAVV